MRAGTHIAYSSGMTTNLIQMPDDVQSIGFKRTGRFEFAQIFRSSFFNFEGTEQDFFNAGLAYAYVQATKYTRVVFH